ncbi:hypothetical protein NPIL_122501 [Nephila pilipes]|uniref:Uncharacterized protein n=1 Tax=Nephila pilipes TaxID=299642 RepID=A0A8X6TUH6_NEPPI|nr:hypothetical protein NPIL_122501 [Nephila pilipes]
MFHYVSANHQQYFEQPLHNLKIVAWYAMPGFRITCFFHQIVNVHRYVQNQFNPFVDQQQDEATAHTALTILSRKQDMFSEKMTISRGSKIS